MSKEEKRGNSTKKRVSKYKPHKIGRPTKQQEIELEKELNYYYLNNIGVEATSTMSGVSISIVSKYFRVWYDEAHNANNVEFAEQQREAKNKSLTAIDWQLARLLKIQVEIESEVEVYIERQEVDQNTGEKPAVPTIKSKQRLRKELATEIAGLQDMKAAVAMSPTIDDDIEHRIKQLLISKEVIDDNSTQPPLLQLDEKSVGHDESVEQTKSDDEFGK